MFLQRFLVVVLLVAGFTHGLALSRSFSDPSQDDFYTPPNGYESLAPGTILKTRAIQSGFLGMFPAILSSKAYQLLYRTTALDGRPIATVTTVFVPWNSAKDRLVAFDVFEDSAASKCAPSHNFHLDGSVSNLLVQVNILMIQAYLFKGWIVSAADNQGPDSSFGAGRLGAMVVLDSIRAVKSFAPLGLQDDVKVVGSGYSGGAIATGWAAALQSNYASELNFVGWAMGGTPANLTGTFVNIDGTLFAGFLPTAIAGLSGPSAYPHLQHLIDQIAKPYGKEALDYVKSHCATDALINFSFKRVLSTDFSTLGDQLLYDAKVVDVLADNLMGKNANETPKVPVFLYHSIQDEVIPYSNVSALQARWCSNGGIVQLNTYQEAGHIGLSILGLLDTLDFVERAFEGKNSRECSQHTVQPTPFTLPLYLEPLFIGLSNALAQLGRGDSGIMSNPSRLRTTVSTTRLKT